MEAPWAIYLADKEASEKLPKIEPMVANKGVQRMPGDVCPDIPKYAVMVGHNTRTHKVRFSIILPSLGGFFQAF